VKAKDEGFPKWYSQKRPTDALVTLVRVEDGFEWGGLENDDV
jgi:hypothetical protein